MEMKDAKKTFTINPDWVVSPEQLAILEQSWPEVKRNFVNDWKQGLIISAIKHTKFKEDEIELKCLLIGKNLKFVVCKKGTNELISPMEIK